MVGKSLKEGSNMPHLLQEGQHIIQLFPEDPQKCNHSFGAESLVKPQLQVFSNVLGVQNLQIHVLVNGFQGALVLHS